MDRLRSRLKRGWNLQSFLKKQPTWLWKCWLLMVLALFLMVQGRQGIWTTRLTEADDHREEGGGRGEIVVGHKVEEEGGAPPRAEQSSTKKHSDASRVQPVVDQTVDIIDNLVKQSGSDTIMKNYLMVKSMMKLYNPEASKWAQRASAKYRQKLQLRSATSPVRWSELERAPPRTRTVETLLSRCGCRRAINTTLEEGVEAEEEKQSMCSDHAAHRGNGQRVLGFSFYGNPESKLGKERRYFQGIKENLQLVPKFYPGWVLRLYYDLDSDDPLLGDLCQLACDNPNIDLCYVKQIPAAGDISKVFAMIWRFFPLLDPQVSHFVSRDLDSLVNARESAAVSEWLHSSDRAFHFMRDHPAHAIEILGSGWGVRMEHLEREFAEEAFKVAAKDRLFWAARKAYGPDQGFLKRYIWPWGKWNAMSHDAYTCVQFPRTSPFPTRREMGPNNFVASTIFANDVMMQECPVKCRPKEHKDWKYC